MVYPKTPYSKKPIISVIMRCHNDLIHLPKSLQSVFNQGIGDLEIIIIDDNSTDNTWQWLKTQEKEEKRIHAFKLKGIGSAASRNFAIQQCKGKYIAFLNPHDEWLPMKLWEQYTFLESNKNFIMSFTDYLHIYLEQNNVLISAFDLCPVFNKQINNKNTYSYFSQADSILPCENIINTSTVLVHKNILIKENGFDENIRHNQDHDLWNRVSRQGNISFTSKTGTKHLLTNNPKSVYLYLEYIKLKYTINKQKIAAELNNKKMAAFPVTILKNKTIKSLKAESCM